MKFRLALTLLAAGVAACGGHGGQSEQQPTPESNATTGSAASSRNTHEMGEEDFAAARTQGIGNVYDLISRFHPEWFRTQMVGVRQVGPTAWLDRNRLADVSSLHSVQLAAVVRVRLLSPSEAQGELGLNNTGGAIVAYTR